MKKTVIAIALMSLLALGGNVFAELCTIDAVPAATLLLPYFEVDLDGGFTTLFSVNNASAAPQLVHVVFWTDLSVPTLDFDIYLTGYDVQTVNLYDVFVNGILPVTYYHDSVSNNGAFSAGHMAATAACENQLPYASPALDASYIAHIQGAHTGGPSAFFGGACSGTDFGDNIARGYITMDQVLDCSLLFPGTTYFQTIAGFDNVLWGDYFYIDPLNNFAQGDNLVHIEADPGMAFFGAGDYTFYHRYVADAGIDQREPLATLWGARYLNGGAFTGGTSYVCWRDSNINQTPFTCGTMPGWWPLSLDQLVIFDEEENPDVPETPPISPAPPTTTTLICEQEATRSATDFSPFEFGWMYMNLNTVTNTAHDPTHQAWVTTVMDASGLFSVGFAGIQLDTACTGLWNGSLCLGLFGMVGPC